MNATQSPLGAQVGSVVAARSDLRRPGAVRADEKELRLEAELAGIDERRSCRRPGRGALRVAVEGQLPNIASRGVSRVHVAPRHAVWAPGDPGAVRRPGL